MSDSDRRCKFCGADQNEIGSYELSTGQRLRRWACGADEHVSGRIMRSVGCYEVEFTAITAELTASRAENERLTFVETCAKVLLDMHLNPDPSLPRRRDWERLHFALYPDRFAPLALSPVPLEGNKDALG